VSEKKNTPSPRTLAQAIEYADWSSKTPEEWAHVEKAAKRLGGVVDQIYADHEKSKK
jgi:hypothetical protein